MWLLQEKKVKPMSKGDSPHKVKRAHPSGIISEIVSLKFMQMIREGQRKIPAGKKK